ncbi:RNA polymerase sigma factor SigJ [Mycobacterium sp. SMC-4]|uniref:RNA polymerase sigma factor SigJ n=1 Tax=Mycobacterium sp. SMC-4 TaxID=2857059 RepID=UPI0021B4AE9C|nr:RNA polymerase sigma factor SigJ [Mycobacterium sp. SMC-4]UXA17148.1 RNA polymerase sigma factor SigJ [Mycobacterium sp. SMC-4]
MTSPERHAERFNHFRPLLFTIAYEILGSAVESDDVLQDSYLRWADVDLQKVRDTKSYLAQLVTREALNALRAGARRREHYVGPWLPEPLLVDERDAATDVVLAESVSVAMLVVLESLTPDERAVFVLREVFGFDHEEIADAVGRSVGAVRQIAHRARAHVQSRRRRFGPADAKWTAQVTDKFLKAAHTGEVAELMAMLAPDVAFVADSGGKATAVRRPIVGDERVARILTRFFQFIRDTADVRIELTTCNFAPAIAIHRGPTFEGLVLIEVAEGQITNFYAVRNPDKLAAFAVRRTISRQ